MKRLVILVWLALACSATGYTQQNAKYFKARARGNLKVLTKSSTLIKRVEISQIGIDVFPSSNRYHPEFRIYWNEIPNFIKLIEDKDYYAIQEFYNAKKSNRFSMPADYSGIEYKDFPTDIKGLRIAICPGHFAGNFREAREEGRLVNIDGRYLGREDDVRFFEADLTYSTALILKNRLESLGAKVMLTRDYGNSAVGKPFSDWLKLGVIEDIERSWQAGDIKKSFRDSLKNATLDTTRSGNRYCLFQFYKFRDFRERSRKINNFHPAITLVLHYNVEEGKRAYGPERQIMPTFSNYVMAFVPGAFKHDEFEKSDQKVDFLRLLLSADVDNSARLADLVVKKHHAILGVPPIPYDSLNQMKAVTHKTPYEGVFARNLYLTRSVRGTVVYGESLYQDNVQEAIRLSEKDYTVTDSRTGRTYQTSSRCAAVADAYFQAIIEFLKQNKSKNEEYALNQLEP